MFPTSATIYKSTSIFWGNWPKTLVPRTVQERERCLMAAFKSAKGHPGNMAKPKFSLFPADVLDGMDFLLLGWKGSPELERNTPRPKQQKKKRERCVMMMTTTKSHEIVFDKKSMAKSRPSFLWDFCWWGGLCKFKAMLYEPTKSKTKQRMVFRTVHGFRLTPWPCESFSPKPSPAAVRWLPIWRIWVGLCYQKSRYEFGWTSSYFTNLDFLLIFCKNSPYCKQCLRHQKTLQNAQFLEPRRGKDSPVVLWSPLVPIHPPHLPAKKNPMGINSIEGLRFFNINQGSWDITNPNNALL